MQIQPHELYRGRPATVLPVLLREVEGLAATYGHLKPGATASPRRRSRSYRADGWSLMRFLYETTSRDFAAIVEDALILHACRLGVCTNQVRGGGGLRLGYKRYWVYVVAA